MRVADSKRTGDDEELGCPGLVQRRQPAVVQSQQQRSSVIEVDPAPVVGVDERVVPDLGALIDVRHAGHHQL